MKPLWTQIPLPKVTDIDIAEYYVDRGWVEKVEDIYIELNEAQKNYRRKLSERKVYIVDSTVKTLWTTLPLPKRIANALNSSKISYI